MAITSTTNVDQLQASTSVKYSARNIIPIPLFMANRLSLTIQATQGDSRAVLVEAVNLVREFDNEFLNSNESVEGAKESCKDLLFWLFLVTRNKVYSIPMIACCDIYRFRLISRSWRKPTWNRI